MLINHYGEFWNPDAVEWGKRGRPKKGTSNAGRLLGISGSGRAKKEVDFWKARGVYALYDNFKIVYVGQIADGPLGVRLRNHLTDRHAGRWDMFSWYSVSTMRSKTVRPPGQRQVKPGDLVNTLEALLINVTQPPLNRRYNEIPGAAIIEQKKSRNPHTIRHYLEEILKKL
jgi:hypothetical protein